ncbi:MAG TPA: hypothetical protein EYH54_00365 [Nautiliaceae bacterium]|nr:hypothetical protein [Nautiliaceae bacterium]
MKNNVKLVWLFSFFIAIFSFAFLTYLSLKIPKNQEGERESFEGKEINQFINGIAKKYGKEALFNLSLKRILEKNYTFQQLEEECNSIENKKEKLLCVAAVRSLKRQIELFKRHLPYALVFYEKKDPECFIKEGLVERKFLAQLLKDESLCKGDEECLKLLKVEHNFTPTFYVLNKSYSLYKKGFLEIKSDCLN